MGLCLTVMGAQGCQQRRQLAREYISQEEVIREKFKQGVDTNKIAVNSNWTMDYGSLVLLYM